MRVVEMFGPYRLDGLLGRGGMGEVHRAFDTEQDRVVALKVLPAALSRDPEFRERFRREAKLASQLTDPHVVPIHRHGEIDGQLFLDMRLVDGEDLSAVLRDEGALPPDAAVRMIEQVASALDAAHEAGLVHRDVKPSNVFLTRGRPGTPRFAYLGDFGIARQQSSAGGQLTATGATLGTLDYMAPERFTGGDVDARSDVYALACLLHEALTGAKPFPGDALPSLLHAHLNLAPPRPSSSPGVPSAFDGVIGRGMAKDPGQRPRSAGAFAAEASAALGGSGPQPVSPGKGRAPSSGSSAPGSGPVRPGTLPPRAPLPPPTHVPSPVALPPGGEPLRWDLPGGSAQVVRWLVAPGQPYAAGTPLAQMRLAGGGPWQVADDRPGVFAGAVAGPGTTIRSGQVVAATRRTGPAGVSGPVPVGARRPAPGPGVIAAIAVGVLLHVVAIAAADLNGGLVLALLSMIVFGTLAAWNLRPPRVRRGGSAVWLAVTIPVAVAVSFMVLVVAALPTGYDSDRSANPAATGMFVAVALAVYGGWAATLWLRRVR